MARLIDGKALAAALRTRVAEAAARLRERCGVMTGLAAILVGDDAASQVYVRSKARACHDAGIASFEHRLPADCGMSALLVISRSAEAASPYKIEVTPGDTRIPRGADQSVKAKLLGFSSSEATLMMRTDPAGSFDRVPLIPSKSGECARLIALKAPPAWP